MYLLPSANTPPPLNSAEPMGDHRVASEFAYVVEGAF